MPSLDEIFGTLLVATVLTEHMQRVSPLFSEDIDPHRPLH